MTLTRRARPAITLIEMMVVMALTLVIMLILAESFKMSLDFVRGANSTGGMMNQLNGAGVVLTRDLRADHFLPEDGRPNRGVRLSDLRFDQAGVLPPRGGFFNIVSPGTPAVVTDLDGFAVHTATNHRLHFTVVLPGGNEQNLFTANVPFGGASYRSRTAEVAYFLVANGNRTAPGPGGQPLYDLVRRYRLVVTEREGALLNPAASDPNAGEVISVRVAPTPVGGDDEDDDDDDGNGRGTGPVNTITHLRDTTNRMPLTRIPTGSLRYGEDVLASNVLSFEVLADWATATNPTAAPGFPGNSDYPYASLPGAGTFDTALTPNIRIKNLQVTIRVFDPKMRQARQNTWRFAM